MGQRIKTDNISGTEGGAFSPADDRAGQLVHFFHRHIHFQGLLDGFHHPVNTNPIADEIGCILGVYDTFAEDIFTEIGDKIIDFLIGLGTFHQFQ